jgi:hypothetical protein
MRERFWYEYETMVVDDDDDNDDDDDDTTIDFLNFKWELNNNDDNDQYYDVDHHLSETLNRLAMMDVMSGMDDLYSIIQWIGSPLLSRLLEEKVSNDANHEEQSISEVDEFNNVNPLSENVTCIICRIITLQQRINAIQTYMGTMAQCRGTGGETLREAGAISALLNVLCYLSIPIKIDNKIITMLPQILYSYDDHDDCSRLYLNCICNDHLYLRKNDDPTSFDDIVTNKFHMTAINLATSCLGSLRDLACGSALNRSAVLIWTPPPSCCNETCMIDNGVHLLCEYVARYDGYTFADILSLKQREFDTTRAEEATIECLVTSTDRGKTEIRMLTNVLGVVRNTSHSTPDICQEMFKHGLVDRLVRLLLTSSSRSRNGQATTSSSLPNVSCPWREASFRTAGSLINLAEKCPDVANLLATNRQLIVCLLEFWGGSTANVIDKLKTSSRALPVLHLGLAAILNAAADGALDGGLDEVMTCVLKNETIRRMGAQKREDERKRGQNKSIS